VEFRQSSAQDLVELPFQGLTCAVQAHPLAESRFPKLDKEFAQAFVGKRGGHKLHGAQVQADEGMDL
jgi:hypothetical protein